MALGAACGPPDRALGGRRPRRGPAPAAAPSSGDTTVDQELRDPKPKQNGLDTEVSRPLCNGVLDDVLLSREIHPTIIGAEAFHCPVRDGKEWFHLAMVVRQFGTTDANGATCTALAVQIGRSKHAVIDLRSPARECFIRALTTPRTTGGMVIGSSLTSN